MVISMMERVCFNIKWRAWIKEYIFSVSYKILINGSPSQQVILARGLRQGFSFFSSMLKASLLLLSTSRILIKLSVLELSELVLQYPISFLLMIAISFQGLFLRKWKRLGIAFSSLAMHMGKQ